jgi:hypothetical protein
MSKNEIFAKANTMAQANTDGYILVILFLYQLSNLSTFPKKSVNPEQKKKRALPIDPPEANSL